MMKRKALSSGGGLLSLGMVWSQAMSAKVLSCRVDAAATRADSLHCIRRSFTEYY